MFIERQNEKLAWSNDLGKLSHRELLIAGAVAYWAEGTKSKPWRTAERVTFVNSDPGMIKLFLAYLDLLGVAKERRRFRVQIHESADLRASAQFWAGVVDVPVEDLQRPTLKRQVVATNRKNVGVGYHGCLTVTVLRSAALYRQIEGTWWAVRTGRAVPPATAREDPERLDAGDSPLRPVGLHPRLARFRSILRSGRNCRGPAGTV